MLPDELCIPVYHVDKNDNNQAFVRGAMLTPSDEDGEWAGNGVYFWDNIGNAHYWTKSRRYKNITISKAMMRTYEKFILDLTEPESASNFLRLVKIVQEQIKRNIDLTSKAEKGAVINFVCTFLQKMQKNSLNIKKIPQPFKVVKVVGYYPSAPEHVLFAVSDDKNLGPHVTLKTKVIYAVRDQTILEQRQIIKEV